MSQEELTIHPIHTSCKDCVFAIYEDNTQTDCHLQYLDLFRSKNIDIIEAYDDDKEFYVINDKRCLGWKSLDWYEKRDLADLSLEQKIDRHHKQNFIKYLLWIDLHNFTTEESLDELGASIKKCNIKPSKIVFVRYKNYQQDLHDFDHIRNILVKADCNNTEWRIETSLVDRSNVDNQRHDAIINCEKRFICLVTDIPKNLDKMIHRANYIVCDEIDMFNILKNKDETAILFPVFTYKYGLYFHHIDILKEKKDCETIE